MFSKFIFVLTYIANIILLILLAFFVQGLHGADFYLACLAALAPLLSLYTLYQGRSIEEKRLSRILNIERMKSELRALGHEI